MCKTPITSALAERAVIPRGELRDLYSLLIQFTSGWDGMFTRACKTLRGARIHLPISPIRLTLAHHTSGQRVRNIVPCIQRWCWITSARHNCGAFISSGCWKSTLTDSALMLIPGVFLLFSQWYVKHLSQKLLTLMARGWFPPFRFIDHHLDIDVLFEILYSLSAKRRWNWVEHLMLTVKTVTSVCKPIATNDY